MAGRGFARTIYLYDHGQRVHSVLAAYLDESFDIRQRGIFAVGGIIGRGIPLFELDRKWEMLLKRPDIDIEYYKASECERGDKQFAKFVKEPGKPSPEESIRLSAFSREFISLITKELVVAYGIGVIQEDFYEVVKDDYARSILGDDPFQLAYDLAVVQGAWISQHLENELRREAKIGQRVEREYVSFVRDDHEKYGPIAAARYANLKQKNQRAGQYMGTHTLGDDKKIFVLQAADAVVYEIRRALHIAHKQKTEPIRGQFKIFRDSNRMGIIQTAVRENLHNTVKLHKPGEPFDLTDIMETEFTENIRFNEIQKGVLRESQRD